MPGLIAGAWSLIQGLGKEIVGDTAARAILRDFAEKGKKAITEDERGIVVAELFPMTKFPNIWRRHAAQPRNRENRFMRLLAKIPVAKREVVFAEMELIDDDEFDQVLTALEHDVVMQVIRQILAKMSLRDQRQQLTDELRKINDRGDKKWI